MLVLYYKGGLVVEMREAIIGQPAQHLFVILALECLHISYKHEQCQLEGVSYHRVLVQTVVAECCRPKFHDPIWKYQEKLYLTLSSPSSQDDGIGNYLN